MPESDARHRRLRALECAGATALSALAFHLSTGLGETWPLAWVAPVPVLVLAFRQSWRCTVSAAFLASLLGGGSIVQAYGPAAIVLAVPPAAAFAAGVLAARAAERKMRPWLAVFMLPAVITAYEFLYALVSPNGTALSIGYSQVDVLPVLQLVSLTGLWGIVFVLMLVPSAIAIAWHRRSFVPVIPALAILLPVLGYGSYRLFQVPAAAVVHAGLAATDRGLPDVAFSTDPAVARSAAGEYAARIAQLARAGAEIVVLPEKLVGISPEGAKAAIEIFRDAARASGVTVVAGLSRNGIEPRRNVALVFSPGGELLFEYDKRHLVPVLERAYARGSAPGLFDGPGGPWGVAICKDLDFPAWLRVYGQNGVRFLAVPAWDFVRDGRLHARMAVVRGVENGFAIARAAQEGLVTFSDAYGRILGEQPSTADPLVVEALPSGPGPTFYTRFGDWFGWASVLLLAGLSVVAWRR